MYWKVDEDKCEIDIPRTRAQEQQSMLPTQTVQPLPVPRHQLTIEDPRLPLPDLSMMMREAQQNQHQNPMDENTKTTYTDERKR